MQQSKCREFGGLGVKLPKDSAVKLPRAVPL
jgi:hypothetical protein